MPRSKPLRLLKRVSPRGLFGRSLIITVAPMVVLQAFVTYALFVRHSDIVTRHMAHSGAAAAAFLTNTEEIYPAGSPRARLLDVAARSLGFGISLDPGARLGQPYRH